ncbi:MAG TPA: NAD(P)-dependent oxidoreductase [Steroidobacteraceae bacterium]|nr:NAD(P)-dependent oxidoreductase [Steroidobacteraceae bacterium]
MANRVFIAGASGVIGLPLCRLLVEDGWQVCGMTRTPGKVALLRSLGVRPVLVDAFDAQALHAAVAQAQPDVVVHQLTDLPDALDPAQMMDAIVRNARMRELGTRHLLHAAIDAGATRFVAQSIAFAYAPQPLPYVEHSPLNVAAPGGAGISARAVASLERQVLEAPLEGIVLRLGRLYGPGSGLDAPPRGGPVHVEAAADATRRALTRGRPGLYNIAEADGAVDSRKAALELQWRAQFRC